MKQPILPPNAIETLVEIPITEIPSLVTRFDSLRDIVTELLMIKG